jgi:hypothetical protein
VPNPTEAIPALALKPGSVRHYVEFHIEQGPQLEAAGLALGVVSGIAGQTWLSVSVEGVQNHGGAGLLLLQQHADRVTVMLVVCSYGSYSCRTMLMSRL